MDSSEDTPQILDFPGVLPRLDRWADRDGHAKFEARQAADQRQQHLWRAEPAVTDDDLRRLKFDQLDPTRHLLATQEWFKTTAPILFLSGTVGRGKTLAACWVLARTGGAFVRASEMWRAFDSFNSSELDKLLAARLLVLDDLGRETNQAKGQSCLETIVDDRRSRGRRTIITTNLDAKQVQARYPDPRLWSRVLQNYVWVSDKGDDLREGAPCPSK